MSRGRTFVERYVEAIWRDDELTPSEKLVALAHARYADFATGTNCYPGEHRIAADTRLGRNTILRARNQLEESGWLEAVTRGSRRGTTRATYYRLRIPTRATTARVDDGPTRATTARVPAPSRTLTRATTGPHHQQDQAGDARSAPGGASGLPAKGTEGMLEVARVLYRWLAAHPRQMAVLDTVDVIHRELAPDATFEDVAYWFANHVAPVNHDEDAEVLAPHLERIIGIADDWTAKARGQAS